MARTSRDSRVTVLVARLVAVLAVLASTVAVALPLVTGRPYLDDLLTTPEAVVGISFAVAGALLVARTDARRIGLLLVFVAAAAAAYALALSYGGYALRYDEGRVGELPARLPSAVAAAVWVSTWSWLPAFVVVAAILPQLVPYGRPLGRGWGAIVSATWVVLAVAVVAAATTPGETAMFPGVDNPLGLAALREVGAALRRALPVLFLVLVLVALASLVVRFRHADGDERRQVMWFGYGLVACIVAALVAPWWLVNAAVLLVPGGIAVAALRYRLYGIDLLVNRTLVGAVLLAGAALVYAAVVGWVGALLGSRGGVTPFAGAFTVALAFHPARVRVQKAVDRMLYGERGDPFALVAKVDAALRDAAGPRQALRAGLEAVRTGLRLPGVAVSVPQPGGQVVREVAGEDREGWPAAVPLALHGERLGTVHGPSADPADVRALESVARLLSSAAYAVRLTRDLEQSRGRVVTAREEERRRLRRDLHDGLGPQLSAVVMTLDTAASALRKDDPDRAARLVGSAVEHARDAVGDVRRLVQGLRPPALDELGLVAALRASGPAAAAGGPQFVVEADEGLGALPAAVEVAAYRIAQEAMTNAVRHSGATHVAVTVRRDGPAVVVEVVDDGRGIASDARHGVGLTSMRERAGELGGSLDVARANGSGTRVRAALPAAAEPQPGEDS